MLVAVLNVLRRSDLAQGRRTSFVLSFRTDFIQRRLFFITGLFLPLGAIHFLVKAVLTMKWGGYLAVMRFLPEYAQSRGAVKACKNRPYLLCKLLAGGERPDYATIGATGESMQSGVRNRLGAFVLRGGRNKIDLGRYGCNGRSMMPD